MRGCITTSQFCLWDFILDLFWTSNKHISVRTYHHLVKKGWQQLILLGRFQGRAYVTFSLSKAQWPLLGWSLSGEGDCTRNQTCFQDVWCVLTSVYRYNFGTSARICPWPYLTGFFLAGDSPSRSSPLRLRDFTRSFEANRPVAVSNASRSL